VSRIQTLQSKVRFKQQRFQLLLVNYHGFKRMYCINNTFCKWFSCVHRSVIRPVREYNAMFGTVVQPTLKNVYRYWAGTESIG